MSFQYFVQITIRETYLGTDEGGEDERLRLALEEIQGWIEAQTFAELSSDRGARLGLTYVNGASVLIGFGNPNKPGTNPGYPAAIRELFDLVVSAAPGSFGLAYYINHDTDTDWTVLVVKRGQVTVETDPWFSPMMPTVEDPSE